MGALKKSRGYTGRTSMIRLVNLKGQPFRNTSTNGGLLVPKRVGGSVPESAVLLRSTCLSVNGAPRIGLNESLVIRIPS